MEGLIDGRDIGGDLALEVLRQMHAKATEMGLALSGVVTDRGGHVVASLRMDGAPLGALPIAADKAYTSALWGMRTGEAAEASLPGNGDWGFATTLGGRHDRLRRRRADPPRRRPGGRVRDLRRYLRRG